MNDDKIRISPDALIAMIVTEAQDRELAQMPSLEEMNEDFQPSEKFQRKMEAPPKLAIWQGLFNNSSVAAVRRAGDCPPYVGRISYPPAGRRERRPLQQFIAIPRASYRALFIEVK